MATSFHIIRPVSGKATATNMAISGIKNNLPHGNPKGDNAPNGSLQKTGVTFVSGK
jgi:hypothetical protein